MAGETMAEYRQRMHAWALENKARSQPEGFRERLVGYCREAIAHYGREDQMDKAIEECGELQVALQEVWAHGRSPDVIGEIADVLIMAEQMRLLFGAEEVDAMIAAKIERQRGRMKEGK